MLAEGESISIGSECLLALAAARALRTVPKNKKPALLHIQSVPRFTGWTLDKPMLAKAVCTMYSRTIIDYVV